MNQAGWEMGFSYALGIAALCAGVLVISLRNPVHSALALVSCLLSVAGLFVLLDAEFLAGVQVLVYVGGVMVLFLFVIMLVSVERAGLATGRVYSSQALPAVLCVAVLVASFEVAVRLAGPALGGGSPAGRIDGGNTESVGADLYMRAALPFEIASVLLLVAIVGAVLLARERRSEQALD